MDKADASRTEAAPKRNGTLLFMVNPLFVTFFLQKPTQTIAPTQSPYAPFSSRYVSDSMKEAVERSQGSTARQR